MSTAWAASLTVSGPPDARSIVVLASGAQGEVSSLCTDDGRDLDEVPGDGIWSCGAIALRAGARVGVLVDGGALTLIEVPGVPGEQPHIDLKRKQVVAPIAPGTPGPPRRGMPALVVEVALDAGEHAWQLQAAQGSDDGVEYPCSDDGSFPDAVANDGAATCAGVAPGDALSLGLRSGRGEALTGDVSWPQGSALLLARWGEDGPEVAGWPLLKPRASEAAAGAQGEPGEPQPGGQPGGQPEGQPGGQPGGQPEGPGADASLSGGRGASPWLALLGAVLAGGAAWRVWRGPAERRGPTGAVPVPPPGPRVERRRVASLRAGLAAAVAERAAMGPVVLVLPPEMEAPWAPGGPVLQATSRDALDVRDTVDGLLRRDPLCAPTVVIAGEGTLINPDGLGVPPEEQVLLRAPPAVRVLALLAGGEE